MYNFNFLEKEELIEIFDEVLVRQNNNEKNTTIALTTKRLLFLDYIDIDNFEVLRITKGIHFMRYKEVYYEIKLEDIKLISNEKYYKIILSNNKVLEFDNKKLYEMLLKKHKY